MNLDGFEIGGGYKAYLQDAKNIATAVDLFAERFGNGGNSRKKAETEMMPSDCAELFLADAGAHQVMAEAYMFHVWLYDQTWGLSDHLDYTKWDWYSHDLQSVWNYGLMKRRSVPRKKPAIWPRGAKYIFIHTLVDQIPAEEAYGIYSYIYFSKNEDGINPLPLESSLIDKTGLRNLANSKYEYFLLHPLEKEVIFKLTQEIEALCKELSL